MIAVDSSALLAVMLDEPEAGDCIEALANADRILISAGTLVETLIVAGRRDIGEETARLIEGLGLEIVSVTANAARGVAAAYERWGKGVHRAGLNMGDCFAYEVAKSHGCPLLCIGEDFARTDIEAALPRAN